MSLESGGKHLRQEAEELSQSRSMQPEHILSFPATAIQADVKETATPRFKSVTNNYFSQMFHWYKQATGASSSAFHLAIILTCPLSKYPAVTGNSQSHLGLLLTLLS